MKPFTEKEKDGIIQNYIQVIRNLIITEQKLTRLIEKAEGEIMVQDDLPPELIPLAGIIEEMSSLLHGPEDVNEFYIDLDVTEVRD